MYKISKMASAVPAEIPFMSLAFHKQDKIYVNFTFRDRKVENVLQFIQNVFEAEKPQQIEGTK